MPPSACRRWLPVVLWAAVILTATSLPGKTLPAIGPQGLDKVAHLLLYAPLGMFVQRALAAGGWRSAGGRFLATVGLVAAFAFLDEWHQSFIPNRGTELADWLADMIGAALGALGAIAASRGGRKMVEIRSIAGEALETETAREGLTLVEFYTEGCPACARFGPTLSQLAEELGEKALILKMDAKKSLEVAKKLGIRGVPTTVAFKAGAELQRLTGAKTLQEMRDWLAPVL